MNKYKIELPKINLNYAIFTTILGYAMYILYSDTVSIHEMPSIPAYVITIILTILITFFSLPFLMRSGDTPRDKLVRFSIILGILASVLSAGNVALNVYIYALMLIAINLILCIVMFQENSLVLRLYAAIFLVLTVNLISFTFLDVSSFILGYTLLTFELLGIIAIVYYVYRLKPESEIFFISIVAAIAGAGLARFILTKEVPKLILTIVIDQLLGISLSSFDFFGLYIISKDQFFMFHFAEFAFLGTMLFLTRKRLAVWNLVLTGLDLSYPPLLVLRILSLILIIRNEDQDLIYLDTSNPFQIMPNPTK